QGGRGLRRRGRRSCAQHPHAPGTGQDAGAWAPRRRRHRAHAAQHQGGSVRAAAPALAAALAGRAGGGGPRRPGARAGGTTVMMRNLPPCYTRQRLIDLLALHGFSQHCDFLYLPVNFELSQNVGYAFLNLSGHAHVERFFRVFEGFREWGVDSQQVCTVCWSETKGQKANIERYRNSPVMRDEVPDEFKPTLLVGGRPVALPPPTRHLKGLRSRKGQKLAGAGAASAVAFQ
ncbi:unnamed protein product, partial [Prorocentrum cordatum]